MPVARRGSLSGLAGSEPPRRPAREPLSMTRSPTRTRRRSPPGERDRESRSVTRDRDCRELELTEGAPKAPSEAANCRFEICQLRVSAGCCEKFAAGPGPAGGRAGLPQRSGWPRAADRMQACRRLSGRDPPAGLWAGRIPTVAPGQAASAGPAPATPREKKKNSDSVVRSFS